MISFIHTADLHFGVENYGRIDQKTGIHSRLLDFENAFNICVDYAIAQDVDFFLICGDVYKTAYPSPTQQDIFTKALLRIYQAGIPTVIIVGNHDIPLSFGKTHALSIFAQLPLENIHILAKPETIIIKTKSGPVAIVAIPWPSKSNLALARTTNSGSEITGQIGEHISNMITHFEQKLDPALPAVLAAHLSVSEGLYSGSEKTALFGADPIVLPSALALEKFDYIALGHLHRYQVVPASKPIIYPGSIERIDFGERGEEKGFCHVTIQQDGTAGTTRTTNHTFIRVPTRRFVQIEILLQAQSLDQTQFCISEIEKYDIQDAIVKIVYTVPVDTKDRVDKIIIEKACAAAWYLVGIFPKYLQEPKKRRFANINALLEPRELITEYIKHTYQQQPLQNNILAKFAALAEEVRSEQEVAQK